ASPSLHLSWVLGPVARPRLERLGATTIRADGHVRQLSAVGGGEKLKLGRVQFNRHREARLSKITECAE
ncbi:Hypothetical predicted protein, partial [Marmota monax]